MTFPDRSRTGFGSGASRLLGLIVGVAAVAAAVTWALGAYAADSGTTTAQQDVRKRATAVSSAIPRTEGASGSGVPTSAGILASVTSELGARASGQGKKFVSKRYGYEIVLAGFGWSDAFDARLSWTGEFPFGSTGQVDIVLVGGDHKFVVAAKRVPAGTTLRQWEVSRIANMQTVCEKARTFRATTLGGVAAREFSSVCPGYDVITVVALHRGRGYLVNFLSPIANPAASDLRISPNANPAVSDRRIFEAGRRAFRFTSK